MDKNFEKQCQVAYRIVTVKLKEWMTKFKKYIPSYVSDYLFYKNGEIMTMLNMADEQTFYFDPQTIEDGIEIVFKIVESVAYGDMQKAKFLYTKFANSSIRIEYLYKVINQLDVFSALEDVVISDLDEYSKTQTDPEILEIIENRKRNIRLRAENERKDKALKSLRQPN